MKEGLSNSYPSALFHYVTDIEGEYRSPSTWFCNGNEGNKKDAESSRRQAYKAEVERFVSATASAADGIEHRVEIMPDGRVAADGENRFGECNIFPWANIKQISCGNWHTVGLKKDGTVRLAHFGTFERSRKQPRRLTLPHNGEPLTLPERTVIRFRPSLSVIRKKPSETDNMPSN